MPRHSLAVVADAIHDAVLHAGLDAPIVVGHSIGGLHAMAYAAEHPVGAVVTVDAQVRLEPSAQLLRSLGSQLCGDRFAEAWAMYQDSWHMELLSPEQRALLGAGDRPGDDALQQLVLRYQSDILERPLEEVRHPPPLSRRPRRRAWLHDRLPQAEILIWPVGHHFPHLAHPARFAALLCGLAAGVGGQISKNNNQREHT